jgi:hypothetical protein
MLGERYASLELSLIRQEAGTSQPVAYLEVSRGHWACHHLCAFLVFAFPLGSAIGLAAECRSENQWRTYNLRPVYSRAKKSIPFKREWPTKI